MNCILIACDVKHMLYIADRHLPGGYMLRVHFISGEMDEKIMLHFIVQVFEENRFPSKEMESFGDIFWLFWFCVVKGDCIQTLIDNIITRLQVLIVII